MPTALMYCTASPAYTVKKTVELLEAPSRIAILILNKLNTTALLESICVFISTLLLNKKVRH
jgi:hypothetical protein